VWQWVCEWIGGTPTAAEELDKSYGKNSFFNNTTGSSLKQNLHFHLISIILIKDKFFIYFPFLQLINMLA
jgi:hypothetical protein